MPNTSSAVASGVAMDVAALLGAPASGTLRRGAPVPSEVRHLLCGFTPQPATGGRVVSGVAQNPAHGEVLASDRRFHLTKMRQHLSAEQLNGTQDLPLG
jgi:hypothetical protein